MSCREKEATIPSELAISSTIFHVHTGRFDGGRIGHRSGSGAIEKSSLKPTSNDIGNGHSAKRRT